MGIRLDMEQKPLIAGQWMGYFDYGPEYGPEFYGEKVTFSFAIQQLDNGQFEGKCIELDGLGMNPGIATIRGYIDGNSIQFTKEYPQDFEMDIKGNSVKSSLHQKPLLTYYGEYDNTENAFIGHWELEANYGPTVKGDLITIDTGSWQMKRM